LIEELPALRVNIHVLRSDFFILKLGHYRDYCCIRKG